MKKILFVLGLLVVLIPLLHQADSFSDVESYKELKETGITQDISVLRFIPIILSIILLIIVYVLAEDNYLTMLLFVFSTNLLYFASLFSKDVVAIILIALSLLKNKYSKFALLPLAVLSWPYFILGTLVNLDYLVKNKKQLSIYFSVSAILILLNVIFRFIPTTPISLINNLYFAELGALHGTGIFILALGIIGAFHKWKTKKFRSIYYILVINFCDIYN